MNNTAIAQTIMQDNLLNKPIVAVVSGVNEQLTKHQVEEVALASNKEMRREKGKEEHLTPTNKELRQAKNLAQAIMKSLNNPAP